MYSSLFFKKIVPQRIKLFPAIYFAAQKLTYVKDARIKEYLNTCETFPVDVFKNGNYMILINSNLVCLEEMAKVHWKNYEEMHSLICDSHETVKVLLDAKSAGDKEETYLFALDFNLKSELQVKDLITKIGGTFINAKESLLKLNDRDCQYVSKAKGLCHFYWSHNYCSYCGNKLIKKQIGNSKKCEICNKVCYPQVSPVGIVLLEDMMHQKVLLVRQERHPPGMYSCIAGFIEPGETLFEGIAREIAEEVGLYPTRVEYCLSQHWAMPSSQLMLGCFATVDYEQFKIDEKEIINAEWVSASTLKELIKCSHPLEAIPSENKNVLWLPPPSTAAHQLMLEWLKKYHSNVCRQ